MNVTVRRVAAVAVVAATVAANAGAQVSDEAAKTRAGIPFLEAGGRNAASSAPPVDATEPTATVADNRSYNIREQGAGIDRSDVPASSKEESRRDRYSCERKIVHIGAFATSLGVGVVGAIAGTAACSWTVAGIPVCTAGGAAAGVVAGRVAGTVIGVKLADMVCPN